MFWKFIVIFKEGQILLRLVNQYILFLKNLILQTKACIIVHFKMKCYDIERLKGFWHLENNLQYSLDNRKWKDKLRKKGKKQRNQW